MKKVLFSLAIALITSVGIANAQAVKLGHIDTGKLLELMPEMKGAQDDLKKISDDMQGQFESMQKELEKKYMDYQEAVNNKVSDAVLAIKEQELKDMNNRIEEYKQAASESLGVKQEEIVKPILDKAKKAIEDVAKDGNYMYIFDSAQGGGILYGMESQDIMPLVKKKLGIL